MQQARELLRDRHLGHVDREGVARDHRLTEVLLIIHLDLALVAGIGDLALPVEQTVAAGLLGEIEVCLVGTVEIKLDAGSRVKGLGDGCLFRDQLRLSALIAVRKRLLIGGHELRADRVLELVQLVGQHRADRKRADIALRVSGEGKAGHGARLRVLKHELGTGRIDFAALHIADGLQRDLQITEGDIVRIDFHGLPVIGSLQRHGLRLAVNGVDALTREAQIRGLDHMQGLGAEDCTLCGDDLHLHIPQRGCREDIAAECGDALIAHLQRRILRQIDGSAGGRDAAGQDLQLGADREIVILGRDDRVVEHIGGLRRGDDEQRRANRALLTVRRAVDDLRGVHALKLRDIGRGAAAVQVQGDDAAGVQHDLGDLLRAAAAGPGLLAAVQRHEHDLAVIGDADAGARGAVVVIIRRGSDVDLAVLHQQRTAANGLLHIVAVLAPGFVLGDHRRAVLQDGEEIVAVLRRLAPDSAVHHKGAAHAAVGHVVEVGVGGDHSVVVFDVICRIIRIGVLRLGIVELLRDAHHLILVALAVAVVGENGHVAARDIRRGEIVDQLLVVSGHGHLHFMGHAGGDGGSLTGEHGIIRVFQPGGGRQIEVIRKRVAAGLADIGIHTLIKICALQGVDALVAAVDLKNGIADIRSGLDAAETVLQEEGGAEAVIELRREVAAHDGADGLAAAQAAENVERIEVSVKVLDAEGMGAWIVIEEQMLVVRADLLRHLFHGAAHAVVLAELHEVADVARPAAEIGSGLVAGVIGHVHAAEHVGEFHLIAVREREFSEVFEAARIRAVQGILLRHIAGEGGLFLTAEGIPGAGIVLLHTGADKVDHQRSRVLSRMLAGIGVSVLLQLDERREKRAVIRDLGCGRLLLGGLRFRSQLCVIRRRLPGFRFVCFTDRFRSLFRRGLLQILFFCRKCRHRHQAEDHAQHHQQRKESDE